MIKAIIHAKRGRTVLVLGLTAENWRRMLKGHPIHFNGESIGLDKLDVLVVGGKGEADILKQLEPFIGPDTIFHDDTERKRH